MANENIVEKFQFKTQIHTAYDGTEQRVALRGEPRRFFSFNYISVEAWQSQYLRMQVSQQQNSVIKIPMWHRTHTVTEKAYKGSFFYKADKEYIWSYRGVSGAYFLYGENINGGGAYYDIDGVSASGYIKQKKFTMTPRKVGDFVCPVVVAVLQPDDSMSSFFSNDTTITMNFEIIPQDNVVSIPPYYDYGEMRDDDLYNFQGVQMPTMYRGIELFRMPPSWVGDGFDLSYSKNVKKLDNETGYFLYDVKSNLVSNTVESEFVTLGVEDTNNLQRFFFRCKGMLNSFYYPTWINDITVDADKGELDNFLSANLTDYYRYYSGSKTRSDLIIFLNDGTTKVSSIIGYGTYKDTKGTTHGKILLGDSIGAIAKDDVSMVSFLCRFRLASDELTVNYDTTGVASTKLSMKEVIS